MKRGWGRWLLWLGGALVVAALGGGAWLYAGLTRLPDISGFKLSPQPIGVARPPVRATFLGVSTMLFDDGETQILIDGFFTRPALKQLFGKVASDPKVIAEALRRAEITRLAAVVVSHSHYDHALDCALVAQQTGAVVVGSVSTANIARGGDVPETRIRVPTLNEPLTFGAFRVTLLDSGHVPSGYPTGSIDTPLRQPARADAYKLGAAYGVLIEHGGRALLVNASAGFAPGTLDGRTLDAVYLGVGLLGAQQADYRAAYWRHFVTGTRARHVAAIHWDNFTLPLDTPLQPLPRLLDDLRATLAFMNERAHAEGIKLSLLQAWQQFDAFAP